jgi:hypothetical protein
MPATDELRNIQDREQVYCQRGGTLPSGPWPLSPDTYIGYIHTAARADEPPPSYDPVIRLYVAPGGVDVSTPGYGLSADRPCKTLTWALSRVPMIRLVSPRRTMLPPGSKQPTRSILLGIDVSPRPPGLGFIDGTLFIDQRAGTYQHPIIIKPRATILTIYSSLELRATHILA